MKLSATTRRARRPRRAEPSSFVSRPPRGPQPPDSPATTTQPSPNLVPHKAKSPESPHAPRPRPPSPVPTSPVTPVPPSTPKRFPKERPAGLSFGRRRGLGAESKRPQNFSSGLSRGILSIRKESPLTGSGPKPASRKPPTFVGGSPPPVGAAHLAFDRSQSPRMPSAAPARTAVFNISSPLGLTTPQKYSIFKRL